MAAGHALDLVQLLEILDLRGVDVDDQRITAEFAHFGAQLVDGFFQRDELERIA